MDDIVAEFLTEAEEGLSSLDTSLVELERDPHNKDVIGAIFRVMHSLKGTSGFLGITKLEKVAHNGENVLNKIREGSLEPTPPILNIVFETLDVIRSIIQYIRDSDEQPNEDYADLISRLEAVCSGKAVKSAPSEADIKKDAEATAAMESGHAPSADNDPFANMMDLVVPLAVMEERAAAAAQKADAHATEVATAAPAKELAGDDKKPKKAKAENNADAIRVKLNLLDRLMQSVSELVLTRNQLIQINHQYYKSDSPYNNPLQRLNQITSELQDSILKTRMQPISNVWSVYPRLVRDLSQELGKKIRLDMIGEHTEIDRHLVEAIKDPLTHMVRNSADHGVERIEDRIAAGKPEEGIITLNAYHQAGQVVISVSDDGKGINVERVRAKCVENGLLTQVQVETMSDSQLYQYIFHPGFSTAEKVSEVSGRGVGMDVVKTNVEKIGGHIELKSEPGKGSEFIIKIPLTLAIMPVIILNINSLKYALPLINVYELIKVSEISEYKIEYLNDSPILRIRGQILPLMIMDEVLFQRPISDREAFMKRKKFVVVCKIANHSFGIVVDKVFDIEEIVVKPNSAALGNLNIYSGCTILGDGSVIMILDPQTLLARIRQNTERYGLENSLNNNIKDVAANEGFSRLLLFKANDDDIEAKGIPMEFINRLEEVKTRDIEFLSNQMIVQYRDSLMRLVLFDDKFDVKSKELLDVIVFTNGGENYGLVVSEIIDIIDYGFDGKVLRSSNPRYLSTVVINGKSTEIIDVAHLFRDTAFRGMDVDEAAQDNSKSSHILLVDDSPFFRKFIPPVISSAGYRVSVVDSVEKAKELMIKFGDISAIVTDLQMPGESGSDLANYVKKNEKYVNIPVIALSAFNVDEAEEKGQDLGNFDAFVPKTHQTKLVETLKSLVA